MEHPKQFEFRGSVGTIVAGLGLLGGFAYLLKLSILGIKYAMGDRLLVKPLEIPLVPFQSTWFLGTAGLLAGSVILLVLLCRFMFVRIDPDGQLTLRQGMKSETLSLNAVNTLTVRDVSGEALTSLSRFFRLIPSLERWGFATEFIVSTGGQNHRFTVLGSMPDSTYNSLKEHLAKWSVETQRRTYFS